MDKKISIAEFEAKVLELEEVVIRIRGGSGVQVSDYDYERKAAGNQSVSDWLEGRIKALIGDLEVTIVAGDYSAPHGRTKMETLRKGYEK
ncbi:MAG: hypothetical protein ACYCSN_18250 [Acidobacteriaceae bacterium]